MERVVLDDLGLVLGAGRPLGQVGSLLDHLGEVPDILLPDLFGSLVVQAGEHPVADDGTDLVLGGGRQDVLLAGRHAAGLGKLLPQFVGLLAEGVGRVGERVDQDARWLSATNLMSDIRKATVCFARLVEPTVVPFAARR